MIKQKHYYLITILLVLVVSCDKHDRTCVNDVSMNIYREAAYGHLTDQEKATVITPWDEADVQFGYFTSRDGSPIMIKLEGYDQPIPYITPMSSLFNEGTELVAVYFHTSEDALLGPLVVILHKETMNFVGWLPRL